MSQIAAKPLLLYEKNNYVLGPSTSETTKNKVLNCLILLSFLTFPEEPLPYAERQVRTVLKQGAMPAGRQKRLHHVVPIAVDAALL